MTEEAKARLEEKTARIQAAINRREPNRIPISVGAEILSRVTWYTTV